MGPKVSRSGVALFVEVNGKYYLSEDRLKDVQEKLFLPDAFNFFLFSLKFIP